MASLEVTRLVRRVDEQDETVRALGDTMLDIKETVDQHTETLATIQEAVDQHTETLATIQETLAQQGETRERHGELLVEILRRLNTSTSD
jgi:septal ring factor EnvC (AmiA/AmiB activator)